MIYMTGQRYQRASERKTSGYTSPHCRQVIPGPIQVCMLHLAMLLGLLHMQLNGRQAAEKLIPGVDAIQRPEVSTLVYIPWGSIFTLTRIPSCWGV